MSDLGSTSLFYPARPRLSLDGEVDAALAEGLMSLTVQETTAGLYSCEAVLGNWGAGASGVGFLYFDRDVLEFGRELTVEMGEADTAAEIFSGRISGIEGRFPQERPPEVLVLAEDRFQDLRMTRRSRTFEELSDAQVIERIASEHGLTGDVDVDGPTHRLLAQVNQSDLAFLRERARAVDAELWLEGSTLHAQARSRRQAEEITLTYGRGLKEFAVTADLAGQRTSLAVGGWDVQAKEGLELEADEAAIRPELNGDLGGGSLLAEKFGERAERIVHMVPLSREEAQALAEAEFRRLARRFVTGSGVAEGDGRLRVGSKVTLAGLGSLFDGEYYVTEVRHRFDGEGGFTTRFEVERPGMGRG